MSKEDREKERNDFVDFMRRQPKGRMFQTPEELLDCLRETGSWGGPLSDWLQKEVDEAMTALKRDVIRQEGSRKLRGSRWPSLDAWIEAKLLKKRDLTTDALFDLVPKNVGTGSLSLYRDGDFICDADDPNKKPLGRKGFANRVTKVRKQLREAPLVTNGETHSL